MKKLLIILTLITLSGCAVIKTPAMTGGSKSDGVVEFSYSYGGFDKVTVDWTKVKRDATRSCSVWGYSSAQAFGTTTSRCVSSNEYGCVRWDVTAKFQCTD